MTKAEVLEVLDRSVRGDASRAQLQDTRAAVAEMYEELERARDLANSNAAAGVTACEQLRAEVERLKRAAKELVDSLPDTRRLLIAREDMIRAYTGEST